jgi:hypothetical protein
MQLFGHKGRHPVCLLLNRRRTHGRLLKCHRSIGAGAVRFNISGTRICLAV